MSLSDKLTKLRKEKRMSESDVAERVGVTTEIVAEWERGDSTPNEDELIKLAAIFETSVDDLTNNDEKVVIDDGEEQVVIDENGIHLSSKEGKKTFHANIKEDFVTYRPKRWKMILSSICSSYFTVALILMISLGISIKGGWSWSWTFLILTPFIGSIPVAVFMRKVSVLSFFFLFLFIYLFTCTLRGWMGLNALWHPLWILLILPIFMHSLVAPIDVWLAKRKKKKDNNVIDNK